MTLKQVLDIVDLIHTNISIEIRGDFSDSVMLHNSCDEPMKYRDVAPFLDEDVDFIDIDNGGIMIVVTFNKA